MSLNISLYRENEEIMAMNWLRNPFGLERWASDNAGLSLKRDLWYVCNHWSYKKSNRVNRQLFYDVVMQYREAIGKLTEGYFFFGLPAYRQFVEGQTQYMSMAKHIIGWDIKGAEYIGDKLAIPMWQFTPQVIDLGGKYTLGAYKEWFEELVEFARLLQNKEHRFYCSN